MERVVAHFFPFSVWYHSNESCASPVGGEDPAPVLYRVREHPRDSSMLAVTFAFLYRQDCGGLFGIDSHPGDIESFSYTLVQDPVCESGWRLFSVKTTAHAGAPGDVQESVVDSCGPLPELFVSRNKHGTYLTKEQCNSNIDPSQRCGRGFAGTFELHDVGSPDAPLLDDLSPFFPPEPGATADAVWTGDGRFCGGQVVADREICVRAALDKFVDNDLLASARQYFLRFELGAAWTDAMQPTAIGFGDIDGDGLDEVAVARVGGGMARLFLLDDGLRDFKVLFASRKGWESTSEPVAIAFGDVDGDGRDEIGIGLRGSSGARFVILDDAARRFRVLYSGGLQWGASMEADAVAFGDVDGDGLDEMAVTRKVALGKRLYVFEDALHGFSQLFAGGSDWPLGSYPTALAFGDVDGDGRDELGVGRQGGQGPHLVLLDDASQGFTEFWSAGECAESGGKVVSVAFGDVDGDGVAELAYGCSAVNFATSRPDRYWLRDDALHGYLILANGGGGEPTTNLAAYEVHLALGDVDGNGRAETAIGRSATENARFWLLDDGNSNFSTTLAGSFGSDWADETALAGIAMGDVDGDGKKEIGIVRRTSGAARLQLLSLTPPAPHIPQTMLAAIGDSLSHGTMDATNNQLNTSNAYLQKVADGLAEVIPLSFSQPFFDEQEVRIAPFAIPTNLGVDGGDIYSVEGLEYYKRVGAASSYVSGDLLADRLLPGFLKDAYDKVLYPINLLAGHPVSQLDAADWLVNQGAPRAGIERALVVLWEGNNDSSLAALGGGGANPQFQPFPFEAVKGDLKLGLRLLMAFGEQQGALSFAPYSAAAIDRNLTDIADFQAQYERVVSRLLDETAPSPVPVKLILVTLPYYSAVGYLMDSEDLEFYLGKVAPGYMVPPTFKRVADPGQPLTDPLRGDRVSLLTFGMMYVMLGAGHSIEEVNRILEQDGVQQDGLVLSEQEQRTIMARIDAYNASIHEVAAQYAPKTTLIDVGSFLNAVLTGKLPVEIGGRAFSRKWCRGGGFSLDGVHPGYAGQALIANLILEKLNGEMAIQAPLYDLEAVAQTDPYIDRDGDGWVPGPDYQSMGITSLLFMFRDPDDTDPAMQPALPVDVWDKISDTLLEEILHVPTIRQEAVRRGMVSGE